MSHQKEDELKLGSITEVWKSRDQWLKYCQYLDSMTPEGYDSEGIPIKLSRYAVFLKVSTIAKYICAAYSSFKLQTCSECPKYT